MNPVEEIKSALDEPWAFNTDVFDLAASGERACRINFNFFRRSIQDTPMAKHVVYDYILRHDSITPRIIWDIRERALLACLKKAYPDPPRSLWCHLRDWWAGK